MGNIQGNRRAIVARPTRNAMTIRALPGGLFQLNGRFMGERVRIRSADFDELEAKRLEFEQRLLVLQARIQTLRMTNLSGRKTSYAIQACRSFTKNRAT